MHHAGAAAIGDRRTHVRMSTFAARQCGLPFVPQPGPDELPGSRLLRIAQLYGLGLTTLLSRLGALPAGDGRLPHWFAIDGSSMNCDALFTASRLAQATLATMAPLPCKPHWPEQLRACERCLAAATDTCQSIAWNRRWMSPLVTVCSIRQLANAGGDAHAGAGVPRWRSRQRGAPYRRGASPSR